MRMRLPPSRLSRISFEVWCGTHRCISEKEKPIILEHAVRDPSGQWVGGWAPRAWVVSWRQVSPHSTVLFCCVMARAFSTVAWPFHAACVQTHIRQFMKITGYGIGFRLPILFCARARCTSYFARHTGDAKR